jgi:cytochrome c556
MTRPNRPPSRHYTGAFCCAVLAAGLVTVAPSLLAQEAPPAEVIFTRKIVMDTIGKNMDELETMTGEGGKVNLVEGSEHADNISVLLMAFAHLFPANTNQWKPNVEKDPGTDTFAAPELFTRFQDFYKQANDAAKTAYNTSRAPNEIEFRTQVKALRAACDACHAAYMKTD